MNTINVLARDLIGRRSVFCPTNEALKSDTVSWGGHPRVYLDLATTGEVKCPYCGANFKLMADHGVRNERTN